VDLEICLEDTVTYGKRSWKKASNVLGLVMTACALKWHMLKLPLAVQCDDSASPPWSLLEWGQGGGKR